MAPSPPLPSPPKRRTRTRDVILAFVGSTVLLGAVGVGYAVVSFRKFQHRTKMATAGWVVRDIARGAVRCGSAAPGADAAADDSPGPWRGLPESSPPVPAAMADVAGKAYLARSDEWQQGTWRCVGLSLTEPQRFQYRWVRRSAAEGIAEARGDLDGDGVLDAYVAAEVHCRVSGTKADCVEALPVLEKEGAAAAAVR